MKIRFDMQAFQSSNSIGGIGKYNRNFLATLFQLYPDNEYTLLFNKLAEDKRSEEVLESKNVRVRNIYYFPGNDLNPLNKWIQFFNYKKDYSDITHILSPFESQAHTVILNKFLPARTVITVYDFIPYIFRELYLSSWQAEKLYLERIKIMKSAELMLAISEATRKDAINLFNIPPEKIINIGLAASEDYYRINDAPLLRDIQKKHGIDGNFILTVSNLDHRKNLLKLLQAYSCLPNNMLDEFSLVVVTNSLPDYISKNKEINDVVNRVGRRKIRFLHFISNEDLCALYNSCTLFVYASLYEGGGLPVLEAMQCGAPVTASNSSSIPEYAGRIDNLFNPNDLDNIVHSIQNMLTNDSLRKEIAEHGLDSSKSFTWENVVQRAMSGYRLLLNR